MTEQPKHLQAKSILEPSNAHQASESVDLSPDDDLVPRAKSGDVDAFNQIVLHHQQAVFAICWRLLRDRMHAEDATQDTFVRAWSAIDTFHGDQIRPWLLRIATNRCLDLLRQRSRQATGSLDEQPGEVPAHWTSLSPPESPERQVETGELRDRLEAALDGLSDDQRIAIVLSDVMGYDYSEIAEMTDTAIGTVKSRISRGRSALRELLLRDPSAREHFSRLVRQDK